MAATSQLVETKTPCLVHAVDISKAYTVGKKRLSILNHINFSVQAGEFVTVMGPSGSGKSTLLHILGCLDHPSEGDYRFDGNDMLHATDRELSHLRATKIGFVFQTFNLVSTLNIYENVALPFIYNSMNTAAAHQRITEAVQQVGLGERLSHKPAQLSGGEMQRVAIARAISIRPKLILADEPTGNLDTDTGAEILSLFKQLHQQGATIVMVTHDPNVAKQAQRRIRMIDGKII